MSEWQKILAEGFSSAEALLDFLDLPRTMAASLAERQFKTRVPKGFARRMQKRNPLDPLLLQVLAVPAELENVAGYSSDPLIESAVNPVPGLIHKYVSRVLLTVTGACAVHCRYCFRRHFPYEDNNPGLAGWERAFEYIRADSRIHEVILSGGDPLLLKDERLSLLLQDISTISHVHTVRFHTRIPIVLPERIDAGLTALLRGIKINKVVVLHCNHPQELNQDVEGACRALREAGCHLLNQSVYLAKVNDAAMILAQLSERLFAFGVLPYYLHALDKVLGAAHFDTPLDDVQKVFKELQTLLPGYLVPRLVREEAGLLHKQLI